MWRSSCRYQQRPDRDAGLREQLTKLAHERPRFGYRRLRKTRCCETSRPGPRPGEHIEQAIVELAIEQPAFGQVRIANELTKRGLFVSPSGVRSVWLRHDLQTFAKRLKAREAKLAQQPGQVLTESQILALEKAKQEKEAHGEIETAHPGYLGAQDTYYVGTIKSIGRIYQAVENIDHFDARIKIAGWRRDYNCGPYYPTSLCA